MRVEDVRERAYVPRGCRVLDVLPSPLWGGVGGGGREIGAPMLPHAPSPLPSPPPQGGREHTEFAANTLHHPPDPPAYACIERRTRSTMRSTVGSAMSSKMSAAGSGICGVVIRTGGPSRS